MKLLGTVTILGAGLLGASFAKAMKKYDVAQKVYAWSRGESTRDKCRQLSSVFDSVFDSATQACVDADLVVVCAPTKNIPILVKEIAPYLKKGAIVTDVGSVKKAICDNSVEALKDTDAIFIGSHPMAGSEKIGIDYSDEDLFLDRPCFITADENQKISSHLLEKVWKSIGMKTYIVTPSMHDTIVARVSHLPHIIAGLLCNTNADFNDDDLRKYVGPGFKDSTRISSGNPEIWDSIIEDNQVEILKALKLFNSKLTQTIKDIESDNKDAIGATLRVAKSYRDEIK